MATRTDHSAHDTQPARAGGRSRQRRSRRGGVRSVFVLAVIGLLAALVPATVASAKPAPTRSLAAPQPTAAVAMGDSFISGEGAGNYLAVDGNGFPGWSASNANPFFCHRSGNASIFAANLPGIDARFNVACSGGQPADMDAASRDRSGGRDVDSQIDQLLAIAQTHDIELVLIGLGSNNSSFTFGDAVSRCAGNFVTDGYTGWWEFWVYIIAWIDGTNIEQDPCSNNDLATTSEINAATNETVAAVRQIIQALDAVDDDYRIVFQDYTNPLPEDLASRYHTESRRSDTRDKFRALVRERYAAGCPIHRGSLGPGHWFSGQLGTMVETVHTTMSSEFPNHDLVYLNVQDAFDGARLCENSNSPTGTLATPIRLQDRNNLGTFVTSLSGYDKSSLQRLLTACTDWYQTCQESWHPNAAGHAVLGQCLAGAWTSTSDEVDCDRVNGSTVVN